MSGAAAGGGAAMGSGGYASAISIGMQWGAAHGSLIGSFFKAKAAKKIAAAQARVARLQASAQASNLQWQAQQIATAAGKNEYALYQQQKARAAKMEAANANRGAMQEGSVVERQVMQAGADAKNRDQLIDNAKNQQYQYIFGAQQALQQGENQAAYYKAMGKANAATAIAGGINDYATGTANTLNSYSNHYDKYGSLF